jgi:hypothetical protein
LNLRPSGYEPDELPGCSTPRQVGKVSKRGGVLQVTLPPVKPFSSGISAPRECARAAVRAEAACDPAPAGERETMPGRQAGVARDEAARESRARGSAVAESSCGIASPTRPDPTRTRRARAEAPALGRGRDVLDGKNSVIARSSADAFATIFHPPFDGGCR